MSPASLDDLERRLAAVEAVQAREAALRASGDRDLSDLAQTTRAHGHLLQALGITQAQHTESLRTAHEKLDRIIGLLGRLIDEDGAG